MKAPSEMIKRFRQSLNCRIKVGNFESHTLFHDLDMFEMALNRHPGALSVVYTGA